MKHTTRFVIYIAIGIPLTALLVWSAIPVVLAGSVQGIIRALFWVVHVTAFVLFFAYARYRDPSCGWYILALILFAIPFATIEWLFDIFFLDNTVADYIFAFLTGIETLFIISYFEPKLKARFPEKSIDEIIIEHGQGDDL